MLPEAQASEGKPIPLRGAFCAGWDAATLTQDRTGRQRPAHLVLNLSVRFTTAWVGQIWGGSFLPSAQAEGRFGRLFPDLPCQDVTGDKLIYDAPTARGGSGGPVLNRRGEVVGINSAYIDGFSGGTLGISATELAPLLDAVKKSLVSTQ